MLGLVLELAFDVTDIFLWLRKSEEVLEEKSWVDDRKHSFGCFAFAGPRIGVVSVSWEMKWMNKIRLNETQIVPIVTRTLIRNLVLQHP